MASLYQENQHQKQTVLVLQREVDTLRGDNVKLYEKIRFLQTYQGNVRTYSLINDFIIPFSCMVE